ncbi:MAG: arylsulfatase [Paludibacteraceae bacterium]
MKLKVSSLNFSIFCGFISSTSISHAERPNVIILLADDMGYSDIGCYGGEIPSPNIDKLAENGIRFRNFYNTSRSCPTRASLLTGLYQHQTGVGMMTTEAGNDFNFGVDGYRGFLNKNCVTIAEVLKEAGYHTYMTGKWHLGSDTYDKRPLQRGFDKFYGSYQGAFSYFDPKGNRCLIDGADTINAPKGFYSTDVFTDKAIDFIDSRKDEEPFFLYLAYNAPHWPLQAKEEDIEKFVGKYKRGWDVLRQERFRRQQKLGIFDKRTKLSERDERVRPWEFVDETQKNESDYRMAVYAAQVYAVDYNVGKLITYLSETNQLDNTLILFLSDNGACAEPYHEFGGGKQAEINDPNKSGAISYGIGWANLSSTPFRLYKNNATEGGIMTPFIAHWPAKIKSQKGKLTKVTGHILNIMPTILEATGVSYPQDYKGNKIQPLEDVSLLPTLTAGKQATLEYHFFEHSNNCAVIKDDWKAISRVGSNKWQLYNLKNDRTETNDVANLYPHIVDDLSEQWQEWAIRCNVLPKGTRTKNSYD